MAVLKIVLLKDGLLVQETGLYGPQGPFQSYVSTYSYEPTHALVSCQIPSGLTWLLGKVASFAVSLLPGIFNILFCLP